MFNVHKIGLTVAALSVLGTAVTQAASAQTGAYSFIPGITSGNGYRGKSQAIGFKFTATANLTVTNVGYFDAGAGINAHTVTFYDASTNAVLGFGTVAASADTTQGFLYGATLATPILLTAGTNYVIGTDGGSGLDNTPTPNVDSYLNNLATFTSATVNGSAALTFVESRYGNLGSEPNQHYPEDQGNFGPGFEIAAAPEPSAASVWGLALASLGGLAVAARRRQGSPSR